MKRLFLQLSRRMRILYKVFLEDFFLLLSKTPFVKVHKKYETNYLDVGRPSSDADLYSDRFTFKTSYVKSKVEHINQYWFENPSGKILYKIVDEVSVDVFLRYRLELDAFYAHFSPSIRTWVSRSSPTVLIKDSASNQCDFLKDSLKASPVTFKTRTIDFSPCRYAIEFHVSDLNTEQEIYETARKVLFSKINSKVSEINELLTGVPFDGNYVSPSGSPLCDNIVCSKCGCPVFASKNGPYLYECPRHGELHFNECQKIDPVDYEKLLKNNELLLTHFCGERQDNI